MLHIRTMMVLVLVASSALACSGGSDIADDAGSDGSSTPTDATTSQDAGSDAATSDGHVCQTFVPDSTLAAKRVACAFEAGALVSTSIEDPTAARAAITHVIVMTHENRSLDHMYGTIGGGIEGFPST